MCVLTEIWSSCQGGQFIRSPLATRKGKKGQSSVATELVVYACIGRVSCEGDVDNVFKKRGVIRNTALAPHFYDMAFIRSTFPLSYRCAFTNPSQ